MRRFHPTARRTARILSIALLCIAIISVIGCGLKKSPQKTIPTARKPRKDVIRPADTRPVETAATPQRVASQRLVANGQNYLDAKNYELAAMRFRDAVNVDPRNGEAYYYLALADFYLEQYDEAMGLLDKAAALLRHDERWLERIENLRASILVDESTDQTSTHPM